MAAAVESGRHVAEPRELGLITELKLRDWHLEYEYVEAVELDEIRVAEWAQVRSEASLSDRDTLEEFKTQMREGAVYPPIVLMAPDVMIDGNHRYRAARALKWPTLPAFVVQFPTVDMAKAFAGAMNQLNGRRLTNEEAYRDALVMFEMGLSDEAIAREIGRSRQNVGQMRAKKEFTERTEALGLQKPAEQIKDAQRIKLAQIQHRPVFAKALEIAADVGGKPKVVADLVRATKQANSDSEAIDALERVKTELAAAGPPPVRITVPSELRLTRMQLAALLKYEANPTVVLDQGKPEDRTRSVDQWRRVRAMATAVLGLYGEQ